jgi:hypothetical protein
MAINPTAGLPMTGFEPEIQDITRQREMAKMLLQKGMADNLQGQMVSGRYVGASPWQGIANMYAAYSGRQLAEEADKKQAELSKLLRQETMTDMGRYLEAIQGRPESITQQQATEGNLPQGQTMLDDQGQRTLVPQVNPAVAPDYNKALAVALGSRSPMVQALGTTAIGEMTKPQKLGADEQLVRFNPQSQKYETIGAGAPKKSSELKDYEFALSQGFKGSFMDYQTALKKAGASNTVVNTEKSYGQAFGQGLAGNDVKLYDSASRAPQMLETVKETRKLLDNDKLYVGFGANQKLDLARAADAFGITGRDTAEKISNTQRLFAARAQATLDSVKESGLGAGNGFTDKDREFLEKSKLGNIVYSKDALRQQLDIEERVARGLAQKWNTRFDQIPDSAKGPTGVTKIELTKSIVESLNPQDREAYDWATKNPSDPRASQIRRRLGL